MTILLKTNFRNFAFDVTAQSHKLADVDMTLTLDNILSNSDNQLCS